MNSSSTTLGFVMTPGTTIDTLKVSGAARTITCGNYVLPSQGTTYHIKNFLCSGTPGNLNTFKPYGTNPYYFVKDGGGKVSADYISFSYCNGSPASTWYVGRNSVDGGNNSGLIFADFAMLQGSSTGEPQTSAGVTTGIVLGGESSVIPQTFAGITTAIRLDGALTAYAQADGGITAHLEIIAAMRFVFSRRSMMFIQTRRTMVTARKTRAALFSHLKRGVTFASSGRSMTIRRIP
jgi:hypothetical protein